jgi:hypothetical protein
MVGLNRYYTRKSDRVLKINAFKHKLASQMLNGVGDIEIMDRVMNYRDFNVEACQVVDPEMTQEEFDSLDVKLRQGYYFYFHMRYFIHVKWQEFGNERVYKFGNKYLLGKMLDEWYDLRFYPDKEMSCHEKIILKNNALDMFKEDNKINGRTFIMDNKCDKLVYHGEFSVELYKHFLEFNRIQGCVMHWTEYYLGSFEVFDEVLKRWIPGIYDSISMV